MEVFRNPVFETKINRAVFINQDIIVFPQKGRAPENLSEAVKFLFGEGATIAYDCVYNCNYIKITGASYVLNNVKTVGAYWECKGVTDEQF